VGVSRYALEIPWRVFAARHVGGVVLTRVLVAAIGVVSSLDVLRNKPLSTLRANSASYHPSVTLHRRPRDQPPRLEDTETSAPLQVRNASHVRRARRGRRGRPIATRDSSVSPSLVSPVRCRRSRASFRAVNGPGWCMI
jgi:hypothetical protein